MVQRFETTCRNCRHLYLSLPFKRRLEYKFEGESEIIFWGGGEGVGITSYNMMLVVHFI